MEVTTRRNESQGSRGCAKKTLPVVAAAHVRSGREAGYYHYLPQSGRWGWERPLTMSPLSRTELLVEVLYGVRSRRAGATKWRVPMGVAVGNRNWHQSQSSKVL